MQGINTAFLFYIEKVIMDLKYSLRMQIFKSCVEVFVSSCALRNAAIKSSAGLFCINTTFLFCIFIYGPEVFPPHVDPDGVHLGVVVTLLGL